MKTLNQLFIIALTFGLVSCQDNEQVNQEDIQFEQQQASEKSQQFVLKSNLSVIAEDFDALSANELVNLLKTMNSDDLLFLQIYSAFANLITYKICQAGDGVFSQLYSAQTCQQNYMQWQQTMQFSNNDWQQAVSTAYSEKNQILIAQKCSSGEIDSGSCQMYNSIERKNMQNMNDIHRTMLQMCTYDGEILSNGAVCVAY